MWKKPSSTSHQSRRMTETQQQMTEPTMTLAREWTKLFAFVRRDVLVLLSYRLAFLADIANLAFQGVSFYFVSLMIDPVAMPEYGDTRASYMAFVAIGIAFGAFMQVGLGRVVTAIRNEQVLGTLESLFMTPTRPLTLQIGLVVYDLLYIPIRTAIFLGIIMVGFGVQFDLTALGPALAILLVFILMVWGNVPIVEEAGSWGSWEQRSVSRLVPTSLSTCYPNQWQESSRHLQSQLPSTRHVAL